MSMSILLYTTISCYICVLIRERSLFFSPQKQSAVAARVLYTNILVYSCFSIFFSQYSSEQCYNIFFNNVFFSEAEVVDSGAPWQRQSRRGGGGSVELKTVQSVSMPPLHSFISTSQVFFRTRRKKKAVQYKKEKDCSICGSVPLCERLSFLFIIEVFFM